MKNSNFLKYWYTGLAAAGAIVVSVAALVLALIAAARSILSNAEKALQLAREIYENTCPIWNLEQTNDVAADLARGARAIEEHARETADALSHS